MSRRVEMPVRLALVVSSLVVISLAACVIGCKGQHQSVAQKVRASTSEGPLDAEALSRAGQEARRHIMRVHASGVFDEPARTFVAKQLAEPDLLIQTKGALVLAAGVRADPSKLDTALHQWRNRIGAQVTAGEGLALALSNELSLYKGARREPSGVPSGVPSARDPEESVRNFGTYQSPLDEEALSSAREGSKRHIRQIRAGGAFDEPARTFVAKQLAERNLLAQKWGGLVLEGLVRKDPSKLDMALQLWRNRAMAEETIIETIALSTELMLYKAAREEPLDPGLIRDPNQNDE